MTEIPRQHEDIKGPMDPEQVLQAISPFFSVQNTKYGGKGCFSYNSIPLGTTIHISKKPVSSTIAKEFKKEVCNACFRYDDGTNMKHKLGLGRFNQYLYFCSQECVETFQSTDDNDIYLTCLLTLDLQYNNGLKRREEEDPELANVGDLNQEELLELVRRKWEEVEEWDQEIGRMKRTKWAKFVPKISESEYMEIKYILGVLHAYKDAKDESSGESLVTPGEAGKFLFGGKSGEDSGDSSKEKILFSLLQSNETSKVFKYPHLLQSYITVYKYVKLTSPPQYQALISPLNIRSIIGKNLTNAFGIWSLNVTGNKDFFGFGVYPSASFFNHSCAPNIIKQRKGNQLHFVTLKDIEAGEELCIDYGSYLNEPVKIRREQLREWFFECMCSRCIKESLTEN